MEDYNCPHCRRPIYDEEALLCHFCGESLGRRSGVLGKIKGGWTKWFFVLVALIALAGFLILNLR